MVPFWKRRRYRALQKCCMAVIYEVKYHSLFEEYVSLQPLQSVPRQPLKGLHIFKDDEKHVE